MDFFIFKKIVASLVLPITGPLLLTIIGLVLVRVRPTLGRRLAWLGSLTLLILSLPIVSNSLQLYVNNAPALDLAKASTAQAIVILGGGVRRGASEYGGDTLGALTLARVRYGALVAHRTNIPVLVTGGAGLPGATEAELMKRSLEEEFGVRVRWAELMSRNTHENSVRSAQILLAAGVTRIILIGHSFDMPRAAAEFSAAGLEVIPAATYIPNDSFDGPLDLMPTVSSLQFSYYALYELLADAVRKFGM